MTLVDAAEQAQERTAAVIRLLRRLADGIETGRIDADACVIGLGNGDLGEAFWVGAQSWDHIVDLMGLIEYRKAREQWGHIAGDLTPAQRRKRLRAQREQERREYERKFPWLCEGCNERYRTERGAVQHQRIQRRYSLDCHLYPVVHAPPVEPERAFQVVS